MPKKLKDYDPLLLVREAMSHKGIFHDIEGEVIPLVTEHLYRWLMNRKPVKGRKVSWRKLNQRVRVFLKNKLLLRLLFRRCLGEERNMRWVSWDQKPAWFNNTALDRTYCPVGYVRTYRQIVKEIVAHSRQRFTVCTCVDSAMSHNASDEPPRVVFPLVFIPEYQESPQGPYDRGTFGAAPALVAEAEDEEDIIRPIITDGDEPQGEVGHDEIDVIEAEDKFFKDV